MAIYIAQAAGADPAALEKARFVRDGFSRPAFVFGPLWLLFHRLWFAFGLWVAVEIAVVLLVAPHVAPAGIVLLDLLARLLLGLEGSDLRLKRGAPVTDLVEARDIEEAEAIFFRRHVPGDADTGSRPVGA